MSQNTFAALLFAMLAGMHPEEPAPEDSAPQNPHKPAETETTQVPEPITP